MLITHTIETSMNASSFHMKADKAFEFYKKKYPSANPTISWDKTGKVATIHFGVLGMSIGGSIEWRPGILNIGLLQVTMNVPAFLVGYRAKAIEVVEQQVRKWE